MDLKLEGFFVSGIGTDIGKTVCSAIIAQALDWSYWKPIQSGSLDNSDSMLVGRYAPGVEILPNSVCLKEAQSPHAAAELENVEIHLADLSLPQKSKIIVEGAGGLLVPLNQTEMIVDLIKHLKLPVILISKSYLGSINHTLLSIEALRARSLAIAGIVFNGDRNSSSEKIIEKIGKIDVIGHVPWMKLLGQSEIKNISNSLKVALQDKINEYFGKR